MKAAGIAMAALLVAAVCGVGLWALGFALSWWGAATQVVSPDNVRAQYAAVIEDYQSLQTAAANACTAQTRAGGDGAPVLVEDPALAYAATYRRIAVDYNRRQANIFEAKAVGPAGYPRTAPIVAATGVDWCSISQQIEQAGP